MKKVFPIVNGVALVSTIVMNYLSNTGVFNGNTMKTVSDAYFNYFTPAGYAFSIWGLIYIGLISFVFYTGRTLFNAEKEEPLLSKIGWWFAISCLANSLWVVTWLYQYTAISVLLMLLILISLLKIMLNTGMNLKQQNFKTRFFIFFPFSMYLGWISVALIANVAAWLTKSAWSGWGISEEYWTVIVLVIAGIINVIVLWKRKLRAFVAVGIWALLAIAVSNLSYNGPKTILYTCYLVASVLFVLFLASFLPKRNRPILDK